ncbi:MAG: TPM domain-containing protein [Bacteroidales bacterium]|nr:TPM domain-containing protein [Bacteroidales bacterium]MBP9511334.1 TPM domain-containing protein [Bacteroidales bacterium]MBP9587856.1 TPM domain-containing protein [Bacteroidales bacterium]HNU20877.1 TPM domain-containing protein [Bacteroidales bacterium]HOH90075.1 TPM domain-containing protein [Bacteroidales bacterium]
MRSHSKINHRNNSKPILQDNSLSKGLRTLAFLLFTSLFFITSLKADDLPPRPFPPRLVNDLAGIIDPYAIIQLEQKLVAFNDTTSTQIAVVTVPSLCGYDIADFTDRLAEKWGVGQKGKDNGVMILVKPKNNEGNGYVRISVGYGLEDVITDAVARRIIEKEMIPYFRQGDYTKGIMAGTEVIMNLSSGKFKAEDYIGGDPNAAIGIAIFIIILGGIFLMRFLFSPFAIGRSSSFWPMIVLMNMFGRGGHKGKWDNFSSGSGWFGGGGSSFGGFGGGSFGGGGASGSW